MKIKSSLELSASSLLQGKDEGPRQGKRIVTWRKIILKLIGIINGFTKETLHQKYKVIPNFTKLKIVKFQIVGLLNAEEVK